VVKIADKVFVGKNPLHVAVWKKKDTRMTYNMVYADLQKGVNYVKRFNVPAITRDKQYPVATGIEKSKILHFSANPNGEAEVISVLLSQSCSAKKKEFDYDFADLAIKGRSSRGNTITKYPIRKIKIIKSGVSTLGAIKIWYDENTGRINSSAYGKYIGAFNEDDKIIALYSDGAYEITNYELSNRFDPKVILDLRKWQPDLVVASVHYDGERKATYVKRFTIETSKLNNKYIFLPNEYVSTKLLYASLYKEPVVVYKVKAGRSKTIEGELKIVDFIDVKGWKSLGNKLSDSKLISVKPIHEETELTPENDPELTAPKPKDTPPSENNQNTLF
jgi:topoisomerase-4 subunit A